MNKQKLIQTIRSMEHEIESINQQIDFLLPDIYYTKNGNYIHWYSTDGHHSTYIPSKNKSFIEKLVINKYFKSKLNYLTEEIILLKKFQTKLNRIQDSSNDMLSNDSRYAPYLQSLGYITSEKYNSIPYTKNPNHPEHLIHSCPSGNIVRSKSEVLIDTALFKARFAYHYEEQLILSDNIFYPDFKIWHPYKKEFVYWEHLGMIDNPRYLSNALNKLSIYAANDILPNSNLILTFETQSKPLTLPQIEKTLDFFFT